jgi:hypothetical protein
VRRSLGGDLLSHPVSRAVPSALEGLTSGFGMGPGVTPPLWPPKQVVPPPCSRVESAFRRFRHWRPRRRTLCPRARAFLRRIPDELDSEREHRKSSPRPISTGRLNALPRLHLRPINLVVCEGPYLVDPVGDLILGQASHLDAFSAYPCRTWLTSRAAGATTGTPEVRPPRSSRTRGSSPQISYAHDG